MRDYRPCGPPPRSLPSSGPPHYRGSFVRVPESSPDLKTGARAVPSAVAAARDGTRLAYTLHGQGTNGVVLVHSLAMDRRFWQPVVQRLAGRVPVLVYDCRGHGESDKPAGPYTVELFARDLADLLDHVGWRSALVGGASMGGCIALAFAAAYPARTAALGLVDTTAWYGAEAPKQWAERGSRAATSGMGAVSAQRRAGLCGDLPHARRGRSTCVPAGHDHAHGDRGRR